MYDKQFSSWMCVPVTVIPVFNINRLFAVLGAKSLFFAWERNSIFFFVCVSCVRCFYRCFRVNFCF